MRFCQSFMTELYRHIGPNTDVPAGDIGVGGREIGFLFGQYKRLANEFTGVLTGKGLNWGGSLIRPEATGYGCVYFAAEMLATRGETLEGKTCLVSGSGNVAQYTVEKLLELGAKPVTLSDSTGYIYDEAGIDREKLEFVMELKNVRRGRIEEYATSYKTRDLHARSTPTPDHNPLWTHKAHCAFPCATQNEINGKDATNLLANGVYVVAEGANMPTDLDGVAAVPRRAASCTGRARRPTPAAWRSPASRWRRTACATAGMREEVDERLRVIMESIHQACVDDRRAVRHARQLRGRRQHRRLPQGRRRDDRPGRRLRGAPPAR